jgi:hypothetical protein
MLNEACVAKGTPVIYVAKPLNDGTKKYWAEWLTERNITWKEEDGNFHINTFVSGDTEELGLSLLSLDNQDICFLEAGIGGNYSMEFLNEARKQIWNTGIYKANTHCYRDAECQYK